MDLIKLPAFTLIGIQLRRKTTNEAGQSGVDCGNLWQEFTKKDVANKIQEKLTDEIFAVYFDYEGDHTKPFSYFIGCKAAPHPKIPAGLNRLHIPEQHYTKVIASGKMPDCIADAWKRIWVSEVKRAFQYDFEIYDERSQNWNSAEVDIYVSTR